MTKHAYEPHLLPDYLPTYYKRLFPFDQYYKWLTYGNVPTNYFLNREFSFTLADDIYVRYQSFNDKAEMMKEIQKKCPHKIDIGAVFSSRPKDHRLVPMLLPREKELVFDIDMTDYDEVRNCCQGADICHKCWKYMAVAVKILDSALREDFGYTHLLWVYSGRRGIHCWVCDEEARKLSQSARSAVAEYLQVVRGSEERKKKVVINSINLHPHLRRAELIMEQYFNSICLEDQDVLGDAGNWNKVLSLVPDAELRDRLVKVMPKCTNSEQRWETIKKEWEGARTKKKNIRHLITEIMFQLIYPRLDINVSKGLNHLLKSPFSIHPKTGRVCVPFDPAHVDQFDPFEVPSVSQLIDEIGSYDAQKSGEEGRVVEYKKTSMKEAVHIFEKFLISLGKENAARRLDASDKKREF